MKMVHDVLPQQYEQMGQPVEISERKPSARDVLRLSLIRRAGDETPCVDVRVFTVHQDGSETAHKGGLRLNLDEARSLRDALNGLDL